MLFLLLVQKFLNKILRHLIDAELQCEEKCIKYMGINLWLLGFDNQHFVQFVEILFGKPKI